MPLRHAAGDAALPSILELIRVSFAYMETRINPPSSMHRLTVQDIDNHCQTGEVWSIGDPPQACVFFTLKTDALYLGRLAVAESARRKGLARRLVELAGSRATTHAKPCLELESRIELTEVHSAFAAMGFEKTAESAHPGHNKPTFIVMQKAVR